MMAVLQNGLLLLVAVIATAVVLTRDPIRQVITLSFYGITLAVLFFLYQAPDVALSQIAIGGAILPLMVLLAEAKMTRDRQDRERAA